MSVKALAEQALALVGRPQAQVDDGIAMFCAAARRAFLEQEHALSATLVNALTIAAAEIVRDKMAELESRGVGTA